MLRRGFKSWCENVAAKYRKELGLAARDCLPPRALAAHLKVLVWTPEDVPGLDSRDVRQLTKVDPSSWSAVTLRIDEIDVMIVNSAHAPGRQASSIMHELAHIILDHKPARADVSEMGYLLLHTYDRTQEDEADWLAGALLVPRQALLEVLADNGASKDVAKHFGVSADLLEWRTRMTGVQTQLSRRARSRVG